MSRVMKFIILIIFMYAGIATAQESGSHPAPETITERCITTPTEPSGDWTFEGTIITFRPDDGVHGFRSDTGRYYIAFDNDTEYSRPGAFSPDGRWFASYLGRKEFTLSRMFNYNFYVTHIRVVSTDPSRQTYLIPFDSYQYSQVANFTRINWLNNSQLAAYSERMSYGWRVINPFTGSMREASGDEVSQFETRLLSRPSAPTADNEIADEMPRAFIAGGDYAQVGNLLITDPETSQVYDTCIEVYSFALSPTGDQIAINLPGDNDFIYIVDLNEWVAYRLDLASNYLIAWVN